MNCRTLVVIGYASSARPRSGAAAGFRCPYSDSWSPSMTRRAKPVMSSIWRIKAAGVRIVSVPPVTSRRSAPWAITARPDASMNRSPTRSNMTVWWPRSIIVSKKAPNSGAVSASTSPRRARTTCPSTKLAPIEKSDNGTISARHFYVRIPRGDGPAPTRILGRSGSRRQLPRGRGGRCPVEYGVRLPTTDSEVLDMVSSLQGCGGQPIGRPSNPLCRRCNHGTPRSSWASHARPTMRR